MKSILILRDIPENFKKSDFKLKIPNSTLHFQTIDINEAIKKFNNLKVDCEMILVDSKFAESPNYYLLAKKEIMQESTDVRELKTSIENEELLKGSAEKIKVGEEKIKLFFN